MRVHDSRFSTRRLFADRALFLLLAMVLARAGNFVAMKISLEGLTPFFAAGARNLIAGIALTYYAIVGQWRVVSYSRSEIFTMTVLGGMLALIFTFVYSGLEYTTASRAALILNSQPLFVALFSRILMRHQRIGFRKASGLVVAFLGIIVVFADKGSSDLFQTIRGDAMVLVAAVTWAVMAIVDKRLAQKIDPAVITMWEMWTSAVILLGLAAVFEGWGEVHLNGRVVLAVLYCAFLGSAFTFAANVYLLKNFDINVVSSFNFLIPIVGAVLGVVILGDVITLQLCIGAVLVAGGIYMVNRSQVTANPENEDS